MKKDVGISFIGIGNIMPLKGTICIVTLVAFLFSIADFNVAWAARSKLELPHVSSDRAGGPATIPDEFNVKDCAIPLRLGEVKDVFEGEWGRTIIHIQDAHCDYSAQRSIAGIIEHINKNYNIDIVGLEGGAGDYDLSIFTRMPDPALRKEVADYFVKEGEVNGAEFYAINNPAKVTLYGIEDVDCYMENLNVYRESLRFKEDADKCLNALAHIMNNLKRKLYSRELLAHDEKVKAREAKDIEFKDYIAYLSGSSGRLKIDLSRHKNLNSLFGIVEDEKDIDFNKANKERNALIDKLNRRLSRNGKKELLLKSLVFKAGDILKEEYYGYLFKKAQLYEIDFAELPNLVKYSAYIKRYGALDKSDLFGEVESLEESIFDSLFKNEDQRSLRRLDADLSIIQKIFRVELVNEDWNYYAANKPNFNTSNFLNFFKKKCPSYGFNIHIDEGLARLDGYRETMEKFYAYSLKRDDAFIKNIERRLKDSGKSATILVTGGFHAGNLKEIFKDKGYSYVEILPNIKKAGAECPYFRLLSGGMGSIVKVILSTQSNIQIASHLNHLGREAYGVDGMNAFEAASVIVAECLKDRNEPVNLVMADGSVYNFLIKYNGEVDIMRQHDAYEKPGARLRYLTRLVDEARQKDRRAQRIASRPRGKASRSQKRTRRSARGDTLATGRASTRGRGPSKEKINAYFDGFQEDGRSVDRRPVGGGQILLFSAAANYPVVQKWFFDTLERLGFEPGTKVLSIACGRGHLEIELQNRGFDVTGIDINENNIKTAQENGLEKARVADARELPFDDEEKFRIVIIGEAIGYMDEGRVIEQAASVLSDDGVLLLTTYENYAVDTDEAKDFRGPSQEELKAAFASAGLGMAGEVHSIRYDPGFDPLLCYVAKKAQPAAPRRASETGRTSATGVPTSAVAPTEAAVRASATGMLSATAMLDTAPFTAKPAAEPPVEDNEQILQLLETGRLDEALELLNAKGIIRNAYNRVIKDANVQVRVNEDGTVYISYPHEGKRDRGKRGLPIYSIYYDIPRTRWQLAALLLNPRIVEQLAYTLEERSLQLDDLNLVRPIDGTGSLAKLIEEHSEEIGFDLTRLIDAKRKKLKAGTRATAVGIQEGVAMHGKLWELKENTEINPETGIARGFTERDYGQNAFRFALAHDEEFLMYMIEMHFPESNHLRAGGIEKYTMDYKKLDKAYLDERGKFAHRVGMLGTEELDRLGIEWIEKRATPELLSEFRESLASVLQRDVRLLLRSDEHIPAYELFKYVRTRPNGFLFHYSQNARRVANEGFRFGWPTLKGLGATLLDDETRGKRRREPGYNFAYGADDPDLTSLNDIYGKTPEGQEAVFFKGDAIETYHVFDKDTEMIFWGEAIDKEKIIPIIHYDRADITAVRDYFQKGNLQDKRKFVAPGWYMPLEGSEQIYLGDDLTKAISWLSSHYEDIIELRKRGGQYQIFSREGRPAHLGARGRIEAPYVPDIEELDASLREAKARLGITIDISQESVLPPTARAPALAAPLTEAAVRASATGRASPRGDGKSAIDSAEDLKNAIDSALEKRAYDELERIIERMNRKFNSISDKSDKDEYLACLRYLVYFYLKYPIRELKYFSRFGMLFNKAEVASEVVGLGQEYEHWLFQALKSYRMTYSDSLVEERDSFPVLVFDQPIEAEQLKAITWDEREYAITLLEDNGELLRIFDRREPSKAYLNCLPYTCTTSSACLVIQEGHSHPNNAIGGIEPGEPGPIDTEAAAKTAEGGIQHFVVGSRFWENDPFRIYVYEGGESDNWIDHWKEYEEGEAFAKLAEMRIVRASETGRASARGREMPKFDVTTKEHYVAACTEVSKGVLSNISWPEAPRVIIMQLPDETQKAALESVKAKTRQTLEKKYGLNITVLFYDGTEEDLLRVNEAAQKKIMTTKGAMGLAYINPDVRDRLSGETRDALSNIHLVQEERGEGAWYDEVLHVVLALGLLDYVRTPDAYDEEARGNIINLLQLMSENPGEVENQLKDDQGNIDLKKVFEASFTLDIKKIDFNDIIDFKRSQEAVLRSL